MILKNLKYFITILSMLFVFTSNNFAQAFKDSLIFNDGIETRTRYYGLDLSATTGIDAALGEENLPPSFPPGIEVRFDLSPFGVSGASVYKDYRAASSFPFSGTVEHRLVWQYSSGSTGMTINYNLPAGVQIRFQDAFTPTGALFNSGDLSGSGSYLIIGGTTYTSAKLFVTYTNLNVADPGPTFSISPSAPLSFPPTAVGGSNVLAVTINNPGTANALSISNIVSSDPQFTLPTLSFPITIAAGGNQAINVTFSPSTLGNKSGSLTFTHNAAGSPFIYNMQGVGADAGPTFSVTQDTLDFGNVSQGAPSTLQINVTNTGLTNALTISSIAASPSQYTVTPTTATIPALGNQIFNVTFNPTGGGSVPGSLSFIHNGAGSPSSIVLSGNGISVFGLVFAVDTLTRKEDSTYTDVIQLKSLDAKAQAIQFRLLVNKALDDNTILRFQNIQKGASVSSADWSLQYEVFRGPFTSNGSSVDSVYVLLYNLNEDNGLPGNPSGVDYDSLLKVNYFVSDISGSDTLKSSFRIANAEASTFQGFPIDITPSRDELSIFVTNRTSSLGDINGDGSLDILDLINVVDHILGRDSLSTEEFQRANIAPWVWNSLSPTPDAYVNVQDLALIQNIILSGFYPNRTQLNKPVIVAKQDKMEKTAEADAKIIFHITNSGIAVRLDSKVAIRGAQLEFGNVEDDVTNMLIDSRLGSGYFAKVDELLRVLLYDQAGNIVIDAGENFVANLPFAIDEPKNISIDKIILVSTNKQKVEKIEIEVIYGSAPELPIDYALFQNYPNPFNPTTNIRFSIPETNDVTISIFNALGEEIRTLTLGQVDRGTYSMKWDGRDNAGSYVSSGMYIYKMISGSFTKSLKMMFIK
ncbi:MAG: choice-of-anchor D domain-containing protein [Ignavibacteriaceae bacterium]|nr:choice-of-anchor D domain-containing protein [Ignavibacteriaceae bacterium]